MRLLQLTERSYKSKTGDRCIEENYDPDQAIMNLITKAINCTVPWSKSKSKGIKECQTKVDFRRYLLMIYKEQRKIKQVPKKCKHKTWTPMQYSQKSTEGQGSEVILELVMIDSKVRKANYVLFKPS